MSRISSEGVAAVELSAHLEPSQVIPALREALKDRQVRRAAALALGELGDQEANPLLTELLADSSAGSSVLRALWGLGWRPGPGTEDLVRVAAATRDRGLLRILAPEANQVLLAGLDSPHRDIQETAVKKMLTGNGLRHPVSSSAMARRDKILETVLPGTSDANIPFAELRGLLRGFGFAERIRGDHHFFTRDDVVEILNLQPKESKAKAYQVKQVRGIIHRYRLGVDDDDE